VSITAPHRRTTTSSAGRHLGDANPGIAIGGDNNTVQGNFIGTNPAGDPGLGNSGDGVRIGSGTGNLVGGTEPGTGNVIVRNGGHGVVSFGLGTRVLGNSIHDNSGLGLSLKNAGDPLPNDAGDGDTGSNDQQNYPVLTAASVAGSTVAVAGTLNSTARTTFRVEFFASPAADPSGFGEDRTYLGFQDVTTDDASNAVIDFTTAPPGAVAVGDVVTTTATGPAGTSEFSQVLVSVRGNQPPTDVTLSNDAVPENQPGGTTFGTLTTADPDAGDTPTYTLVAGPGDADNASFTIVGDQLRTGAVFDFESRTTFTVRVRTTDPDGLSFEKPFTITISDVNEVPAVTSGNFTVPENTTAAGTVTAADPDAGGPYTVAGGGSVVLTGSGTDPDAGDTLSYA
jgi:hypothetical protein